MRTARAAKSAAPTQDENENAIQGVFLSLGHRVTQMMLLYSFLLEKNTSDPEWMWIEKEGSAFRAALTNRRTGKSVSPRRLHFPTSTALDVVPMSAIYYSDMGWKSRKRGTNTTQTPTERRFDMEPIRSLGFGNAIEVYAAGIRDLAKTPFMKPAPHLRRLGTAMWCIGRGRDYVRDRLPEEPLYHILGVLGEWMYAFNGWAVQMEIGDLSRRGLSISVWPKRSRRTPRG